MSTGIEWTDETWNPVTGCDQVSPGCDNCYALTMAARLKAMGQDKYQRDGDPRTSGPGFGVTVHTSVLEHPLRWAKPRRVFVNSMSDLFHPDVTDGFIGSVFRTMALAERHTFQVLTKRPKRMGALMRRWTEQDGMWRDHRGVWQQPRVWPLPNVWLGTSVEDQQRADQRVPALLDTPAAIRFLSCEPLLGPVDLRSEWVELELRAFGGNGAVAFPRVDWVIVGGESGPNARPMHPAWVRRVRDECTRHGVPFFFKQWGAWAPSYGRSDNQVLMWPNGTHRPDTGPPYTPAGWTNVERVGKHDAGRELDGRTWDEFPASGQQTLDVAGA